MPGLLDNINNPWMALGAGLLQAGGPHLDPSKASLGAGLTSGLNAISAQQQMQFKQALLQQQQEQAAVKQKADWAKVQEEQAEAKRKEEGRGILLEGIRTKNPLMIHKGGLVMDVPPAAIKGLVAQMGLNPDATQSGGFEGKGMDAQMYNSLLKFEAMTARGEPLTATQQYQHALAKRHFTQPKIGRTESGNPYSVPQAGLPAFPAGAQGETGVSGQGVPSPFFFPDAETQRVRQQLPPGRTPAQVAAAPGLNEPSVSEVMGAPPEQPVDWIVDATNPETGQKFSFGDPALDQRSLQGAVDLNTHVAESDNMAQAMMRNMTRGQQFTPSQIKRLGYPRGTLGHVIQDGPHKRIAIKHKGKELTENERKQSMQIQLAIDHMEELESLAKTVPLGETDYWLKGLAAGNSNAANMGRALLNYAKDELDIGPGTEMGADALEMISRTQALSNVLLALYRGAQVGPLEQDRFDRQLPMPFMDRGMFMSNLENQKRSLNKAITIINQRTGSSLDTISTREKSGTTITAERDPSGRPVVSSGQQGEITVDFNSLGIRR